MLCHPTYLRFPNAKHGKKIRNGYLNLALSGAHKTAEMLRHPYILSATQRQARRENVKWLPHPSLLVGREEGGYAMSPLHSGVRKTKHGDKIPNGPQARTSPTRKRFG